MLDAKNGAYKETLQKGLDQHEELNKVVDAICEKGINKVFLIGCGGSLSVMYPSQHILDTRSTIPAYAYNSSEFLNMGHKKFDEKSLVIVSSYTGSTKETVAVAKMAKAAGAPTIAFMGKLGTPLADAADYAFANDAVVGVTDSKLIMLYQVVFRIMKNFGQCDDYDAIMAAMKTLPENIVNVREKFEPIAEKFAIDNKETDYYMVISAGLTWFTAYSHAMCILEEMQWINARSVPAGEFFHGSFEIVTDKTHVLLYRGEDESRPLGERAQTFLEKYNSNTFIIDTKDYELPGVPEELRGLMSPYVIMACQERMNKHLEDKRNHSLAIRRYMGVVPY
ncbi:SIS domain-containing protein [Gottschalkiaceae bacterium SANA]|nr:SIS domain-containing protein [Gottschalkiaceae bacterium SANA]